MKKKKKIIIFILFLFLILTYILWDNKTIKISRYTVEDKNIPEAFDGFTILQISDFHNSNFGNRNKRLIDKIKKENYDIIAITGDMLFYYDPKFYLAENFIDDIPKQKPIFFVTGNHEARMKEDYARLKKVLEKNNIKILDGKSENIIKDGKSIEIFGIEDPKFKQKGNNIKEEFEIISKSIDEVKKSGDYRILLSHRPEAFEVYSNKDINLVLTGHTHGGQIRIPFIGGIIAPNQGFFPKYDSGIFKKDKTFMVISRGLGNSIVPVRINNRPEIVIVKLKRN